MFQILPFFNSLEAYIVLVTSGGPFTSTTSLRKQQEAVIHVHSLMFWTK